MHADTRKHTQSNCTLTHPNYCYSVNLMMSTTNLFSTQSHLKFRLLSCDTFRSNHFTQTGLCAVHVKASSFTQNIKVIMPLKHMSVKTRLISETNDSLSSSHAHTHALKYPADFVPVLHLC